MRTDRVEVDTPALDPDLRFLERVKGLAVETFIPQFAVERFTLTVLLRAARLDVERSLSPALRATSVKP